MAVILPVRDTETAVTHTRHPGQGLPQPPEWYERALCAQTDPESFYPKKGGSTREAKKICRRCTVSAECLTYALDNEERFGIWGGFSERERHKLLKSA